MSKIIIIVLLSALFVGSWCFPQEMVSTARSVTKGIVGAGRNRTDSSSISTLSMTLQVESTMSTMVANNGSNTNGKKHDKKAKHHHEKRSITTQKMKKKNGKGRKGKKSKATTEASTE